MDDSAEHGEQDHYGSAVPNQSLSLNPQNVKVNVIAYCQKRFNEVLRETASLPIPNTHRTQVCCELLFQLSESIPRWSHVLKPITKELLSSIYHASSGQSAAETYFQLVRDLRQKLNVMQQTMTELELRRQKLESNEARRVQVLERSAKKWQHNLLVNSFLIWRNHVRVLRRQRRSFEHIVQIWNRDPNLLRNTFLIWKLDHLLRKRESIETQLDAAVQRHIETETQTIEARDKIHRRQQEIAYLNSMFENLKQQRDDVEKSISEMECQIAQSKDRDINATITTVIGLVRSGLFALSDEIRDLRQLQTPDLRKLFSSSQGCQLDKISDQNLLFLWVNYHLRLQLNEEIENFSSDFADGKALSALLSKVCREDVKIDMNSISKAQSSFNRCSIIVEALSQADTLPSDLRQMLKPSPLVYSLMPDITAVFLARLFTERPGLFQDDTELDQAAETVDIALDALDHLSSDNDSLDETVLNDVIDKVRHSFRSVALLQDTVNSNRAAWEHLQWRLRRFGLNTLIRRCGGHPIYLTDQRTKRRFALWTTMDEMFLLECLNLCHQETSSKPSQCIDTASFCPTSVSHKEISQTILQIRHIFASHYNSLHTVFLAYSGFTNRHDTARINFVQFWILSKNCTLLDASMTAHRLKELFESVASDSNVDDVRIGVTEVVKLIIQIARATMNDCHESIVENLTNIVENHILKLTNPAYHIDDVGFVPPTLVQVLQCFTPALVKLFQSATSNTDITLCSIALDDIERLYKVCNWQTCNFSLEHVIAIAARLADNNRILMFPEFLSLLLAQSTMIYPNPLEDSSQRLTRFLTVNMQIAPTIRFP